MRGLQVNGQQRTYNGDPSTPFIWFLRDQLALTGAKYGCGARTTEMSEIAAKSVTTIEGLHPSDEHLAQVAWRGAGLPQCGYCQPVRIMQPATLLAKTPAPSDAQIFNAMAGNLCRCGCYQRIHQAIRAAAGRA